MAPQPRPKTATVTLEIVNDDGSKTLLMTEQLDASALPADGYHRQSTLEGHASHVMAGLCDPYADEDWRESRRYSPFDTFRLPPLEDHFFLKLRMPAVKKTGPVYHIKKIEAPDTRVIMLFHSKDVGPTVCAWSEAEIQEVARKFPNSIYFFLDIP